MPYKMLFVLNYYFYAKSMILFAKSLLGRKRERENSFCLLFWNRKVEKMRERKLATLFVCKGMLHSHSFIYTRQTIHICATSAFAASLHLLPLKKKLL